MRILINDNWEFALHKGFEPMEKQEMSSLTFKKVTLPHDWAVNCPLKKDMPQAEAQGFFDRWGIGWYRKNITLQKEEGRIYRLYFEGVYENSTVWVNDVCVGGRKYGYSSFYADFTDVAKNGENTIVVKVDNTALPADRWYSGAGIYRNVYLENLPVVHLEREDIQVNTKYVGVVAEVSVTIGQEKPMRVTMSYDDKSCNVAESDVVEHSAVKYYAAEYRAVGENGVATVVIPDYVRWSAETPELYQLKVELLDDNGNVLDEQQMKIGLREVSLSGEKGLIINGQSVKLKGVCVHQEAGCLGTAVSIEIWRERLQELKAIGCNALRFAHHIFMPDILDLCDEMGFYVYEECFDKWTGGAYGRYYETEWEKDITTMVVRDRNHACILFWGVGNEVENQAYESMLQRLEKHVALVKQMDSSRPVSIAMNPHFSYPTEEVDMSTIEDIQQYVDEMKTGEIFDVHDRVKQIKLIADRVDFICCNYQEQWYDLIHKAVPEKAILGTETYMYFRGYADKFQNFDEVNPWFDVENKEYCIGGMLWTGIDYLGESMAYPAKGWSGALFSTDMEKRPIAWIFQSYWSKEPMIRFAVMDYSLPDEGAKEHWDYPRYVTHWEFPQFSKTVIPYMIATNCEQVEIHVNEKEFLLKPTAEYPNHMIKGYLPYLPGEVTVIGKNDGVEVCRQVIKTPKMAVKLAFEKEEQRITLKQEEERIIPYQMLLKVRAFDEEGNPVFRESAKVQFCVEGPAEIIGVDNGDVKNHEPFGNDFIHLYRGKASVAIRITGQGRVRVTAFAEGMAMAQAVVVNE